MIECNITYVMVFFSKYSEIFVFEFFELYRRKERSGLPGAQAPFEVFRIGA
jgi:hypothetical protein